MNGHSLVRQGLSQLYSIYLVLFAYFQVYNVHSSCSHLQKVLFPKQEEGAEDNNDDDDDNADENKDDDNDDDVCCSQPHYRLFVLICLSYESVIIGTFTCNV